MSENHPSKPIRKAGPTTGELVLDRGLASCDKYVSFCTSAGSDGCDPPQALRKPASPLRLLYALYGGGHRKSR